MPLLDHFLEPHDDEGYWRSFASNWIVRITDSLYQLIPPDFVAFELVKSPVPLSVDVEADPNPDPSPWRSAWQPPPEKKTAPMFFPDRSEVHVFRDFGGRQLVAVVTLVGPSDKAEPRGRDAFIAKVVSLLRLGVCVLVVDVVTNARANLQNLIARRIGAPSDVALSEDASTYAASYRPVIRDGRPEIDIWVTPFAVGDVLPTMPLRLIADYFVPVELEATYTEACRRRRLIP